MSSVIARLAVIGLIGAGLCGCASSGSDFYGEAPPVRLSSALPPETGSQHTETLAGQAPLQCVPYAREHSPIKIFGDAWTWWDQALGKYERGGHPAAGTVMVLNNYAGAERGHVAVVRQIVSGREIRVDHANWLDDGAIYVNDPVVDVSAANDWSQVRVWNIRSGGWGGKIYPVQGFIGAGSSGAARQNPPDDAAAPDDPLQALLASAQAEPAAKDRLAAAGPEPPSPAATPLRLTVVSAGAGDIDPPPDSPHALSPQDLALP